MRLGEVSRNGGVYFTHPDINECRAFLREHGLECEHTGWQGRGRRGAIFFNGRVDRDGRSIGTSDWTATYWEQS